MHFAYLTGFVCFVAFLYSLKLQTPCPLQPEQITTSITNGAEVFPRTSVAITLKKETESLTYDGSKWLFKLNIHVFEMWDVLLHSIIRITKKNHERWNRVLEKVNIKWYNSKIVGNAFTGTYTNKVSELERLRNYHNHKQKKCNGRELMQITRLTLKTKTERSTLTNW